MRTPFTGSVAAFAGALLADICADHNSQFFVPTGELRQTEVHASWQGSCVRGDLFFEAPDGVWERGTYTLVIAGDTDIRLPIEIG